MRLKKILALIILSYCLAVSAQNSYQIEDYYSIEPSHKKYLYKNSKMKVLDSNGLKVLEIEFLSKKLMKEIDSILPNTAITFLISPDSYPRIDTFIYDGKNRLKKTYQITSTQNNYNLITSDIFEHKPISTQDSIIEVFNIYQNDEGNLYMESDIEPCKNFVKQLNTENKTTTYFVYDKNGHLIQEIDSLNGKMTKCTKIVNKIKDYDTTNIIFTDCENNRAYLNTTSHWNSNKKKDWEFTHNISLGVGAKTWMIYNKNGKLTREEEYFFYSQKTVNPYNIKKMDLNPEDLVITKKFLYKNNKTLSHIEEPDKALTKYRYFAD